MTTDYALIADSGNAEAALYTRPSAVRRPW
jgi:hypothetical protein